MHGFETVLALLAGGAFRARVARGLDPPAPAVLVVGGLLVALVPGLPAVQFDPQVVFLVFIPPLLYRASLLASYRDVRANLRPILLLGVGHVLFVTAVVAWVARLAVPGLPWASAFALGAVVSPPDVAAATAFLRRLPLPRRLVTILEGGSMINDAAAIVAYRMAVAAGGTGVVSPPRAPGRVLPVGGRGGAGGGRPSGEERGGGGGVGGGAVRGGAVGGVSPGAPPPRFVGGGGGGGGPAPAMAVSGSRFLGGPARRGVPGAGCRHSHHDRRGYAVPRPRPGHRDHVRRDRRDAAGPGLHAGAADALAGRARNGRRRAPRGARSAYRNGRGGPRAAGGARDGVVDAPGRAVAHP